jgi:hypothetical protein
MANETEFIKMGKNHKPTITRDTNAFIALCKSKPPDVWITFYKSYMYWGVIKDDQIEEEEGLKFRELDGGWSKSDLNTHRDLHINKMPGAISRYQAFRATLAEVARPDILAHLINGTSSSAKNEIVDAKKIVLRNLPDLIKQLNPYDLETLVDLIYRNEGWMRTTVLGKQMKAVDMELENISDGRNCAVQVKTRASLGDVKELANNVDSKAYDHLVFVASNPNKKLIENCEVISKSLGVEVMFSERLSEKVWKEGLIEWILDRVV